MSSPAYLPPNPPFFSRKERKVVALLHATLLVSRKDRKENKLFYKHPAKLAKKKVFKSQLLT